MFISIVLSTKLTNRYGRYCHAGLLVLFVVWLGMDISGAMYNPTLASLLVGGCRGHSLSDHVLVYWVPPVAAAFSGEYLCSKVERGAHTETAKIKKKL